MRTQQVRPKCGPSCVWCYSRDANGYVSITITKSEGWYVRDVQVAPPILAKANSWLGAQYPGIATMIDGTCNRFNMLQGAAHDGWRGLTVEHMNNLIDHFVPSLAFAGGRPVLEAEVAEALVRWHWPNASDADVQEMVGKRPMRARPVFASAMHPENVRVIEKEGGDQLPVDAAELEAKAETYRQGLAQEPTGKINNTASSSAACPSASSSSSGVGNPRLAASDWRALPSLPDGILSRPEATQFLPSVTACTVAHHKESAWMIKYPTSAPPRSHSVSFTPGDGPSSSAALRECLLWFWRAHHATIGDPCPYCLGEPI